MKPLSEKIEKNGFSYTQLLQEGRKYIFEQRLTQNQFRYEVFRAKIKPAQTFNGVNYPERYVFPSNEDFGRTAWTCNTFKRAKERFNSL